MEKLPQNTVIKGAANNKLTAPLYRVLLFMLGIISLPMEYSQTHQLRSYTPGG